MTCHGMATQVVPHLLSDGRRAVQLKVHAPRAIRQQVRVLRDDRVHDPSAVEIRELRVGLVRRNDELQPPLQEQCRVCSFGYWELDSAHTLRNTRMNSKAIWGVTSTARENAA